MTAALRAAVVGRVAAALPGAVDVSADPEGAAAATLPAFAVSLRLEGAPVDTIGAAPVALETWGITVAAWLVGTTGAPLGMAALDAAAAAIRAAVMGAPRDLGDLARHVAVTGQDLDVATGERRVGRVLVTFEARVVALLGG